MLYTSISLNGDWEMDYQEEAYKSKEVPFEREDADKMRDSLVLNAVPGYWEDMVEKFRIIPFFHKLKINPEYGIQQYPIRGTAPDMALPNIYGNFFYRRNFFYENSYNGNLNGSAVVYFEGVQNSVSVWINNVLIGRHEGYSAPFYIEIPDGILINGENSIVLSVSNYRLEGYNKEPISGLTSRAANEYTGGITGDVEIRIYHSPLRDVAFFVSEDCMEVMVKVEAVDNVSIKWAVYDGNNMVKNGNSEGDFTFDTSNLERWTPENPKLYTMKISCGASKISRKFGVRRLTTDNMHFRLNGVPYFLRGICEHCYYPDTIHPTHDLAYYKKIIKTIKNLGFNFIRFHTHIPTKEYMQAADELGILLHVECPNNTSLSEWREIVKYCRRHVSVVIYCCGNELLMDEPFIAYLHECADVVHECTDALFSPLSALRGLEYAWDLEPGIESETVDKPFRHHPKRFKMVEEFCDLYSSYANGLLSYDSIDADPQKIDEWSVVYNKPQVSHEICIDGTYIDLSLKDRYKGTRIEKTDMFTSVQRHLESKGLLKKAQTYYINSCEWQRRLRKFCFEAARRCNNLAGYDFLGPIDTHWHTFGYDVGMMNEFYELKPGETVRNILMYNSATVLLTDLGKKLNFVSGEELSFGIYTSHYGNDNLLNTQLNIRLIIDGKVKIRQSITIKKIENGKVSKLHDFLYILPETEKPYAMKLYVTLDCNELFSENEWELYLFPKAEMPDCKNIIISNGMSIEQLKNVLEKGKDVLMLGSEPFQALPTSFRILLAGRTSGNAATIVNDHPILKDMPHDGFCGWQFSDLMDKGKAVCFESENIPFDPIIEVVSSHKYVIRQAALFEFSVLNNRLVVCTFDFKDKDPAARWLLSQIISYMQSEEFNPKHSISIEQLYELANRKVKKAEENKNIAFNPNDKTAMRRLRDGRLG